MSKHYIAVSDSSRVVESAFRYLRHTHAHRPTRPGQYQGPANRASSRIHEIAIQHPDIIPGLTPTPKPGQRPPLPRGAPPMGLRGRETENRRCGNP